MSEQLVNKINSDQLSTLLLPMDQGQLILPNVTVAEIIAFDEVAPVDGAPDWLLGMLEWRTQKVPLISFERINELPYASDSASRRIAVLNGVVDSARLPFCAMVTAGVPRGMRVQPAEVSEQEVAGHGPAEIASVVVNGEAATIPNIDWIQAKILDVI
jgi:chemosensory pili system protein ChpC